MPRHLPVLNTDAAPTRPRYQWVLIAAGFTVTLWLPLLALALALSPEFDRSSSLSQSLRSVVPLLLSYLMANASSAALMRRFSGGVAKHAVLWGSVAAAGSVSLLALLGGVQGGILLVGAVALALTGGAGALAGFWLAKKAG
jgi:hypothetical protein